MSQARFWLPKEIYDKMIAEAEKRKPLETGGAFMGYIAENKDVVVTDMIDAGENAVYRMYSFTPDQDYQLGEIEKIFYGSERKKNYLGDWHTHPNNTTDLSFKDKKTLTKIAISPESQNPEPIMVILGDKSKEWIMNAVQFYSGNIYLGTFVACKYKKLLHAIF